jgi:hypothetical protein
MDADEPDVFAATADEFAVWAEQAAGAAGGDPEEARLLLGLIGDYLSITDLAGLRPADLRALLLDIYPRKITVLNREDTAGTMVTARALLRFMEETGRAASVAELQSELDEIEPGFADAVMDPARWGLARSVMHAMASDGVDIGDESAVDRWIAIHNARQQLGLLGDEDPFDDGDFYGGDSDDSDDDLGDAIREGFGLPDRLPALRLPDEAELASAARQSRLLARARALAVWADGRELTDDGDLVPADLAAAAQLLGLQIAHGAASIDQAPGLRQAWHLACCVYFADDSGDYAAVADSVDEWPDGDDDEVLDAWGAAFGHVCGHGLPVDGLDEELSAGLSLRAPGAGLAMALFLARSEGLQYGECRSLVNEFATADLTAARARKAQAAWVAAHGEMADLLLDQLSEHGAVERDGDVVRLTPLAMWQMREELADTVEIPLLPPPAEMTATDLVAFGADATEEELARERQAWLATRPAEDAARELLSVAAAGGPAERMMGAALATAVGAAAEPLWREALEDPALGSYAKVALNEIAGRDPAVDPLPGLEVGPGDAASMLSDTVLAMSDAIDGEELAMVVSQAVPRGREEELFELMWRSANPAAQQALGVLGRHHPDKKTAKAARKAAFKARSRSG